MSKFTLALSLCALLFSGCGDDDNPVDDDHNEEHAEALGLIVRNSGAEIVRYENGEVQGHIEVGHLKETPLLSIRFIDEDGDLFTPDADEGFNLGWEITDESIAEIERHDEDGSWAFHIVGLEEGETSLVLKLNHFDHADFVSPAIEIHVKEDGPGEALDGDHDHEDHDHEDE